MTSTLLIVGSGPAAVGAALAASKYPDVQVTVLDVGGQLETDKADARQRLSDTPYPDWSRQDVAAISRLPVASAAKGLPEKRSYGSDYPFRDFGQRRDLNAFAGINDALVSGAYGGFSNVWGAQFMPFTAATFSDWPVSSDEMHHHYQTVLQHVPYAAEQDDLAKLFPVFDGASSLPPLAQRSHMVLDAYAARRGSLNAQGVILGRARLAMDAPGCVRCGLCMTGCPYSLIYSAAQTMDRLRETSGITYHGGLLAVDVREDADQVSVTAEELSTGRLQRFSASRVLLACGAVGTARLVMGSLSLVDIPIPVLESRQFMLPFASRRPVADPRTTEQFTLNQFNMAVTLDSSGLDLALLHFYTYDPAFDQALPGLLRRPRLAAGRGQLLRRICVALGYLPSWASPKFILRAQRRERNDRLPELSVTLEGDQRAAFVRNRMLRAVLAKVATAAPWLDLWPVLPALRFSAEGKSYHLGGSFPHATRGQAGFSSDTLGRVAPWRRVHLVDSSVFPSVPATTFALTTMANAHRITDAALASLDS